MKLRVSLEETIPWALHDLVAFLRVADHRSFSRAAAVLGESKGSVSKRLRRLEDALGVRLLQRTSRTVAVTEAGVYFREAALAALDTLAQATTRIRVGQEEPQGTLRLTAPHDLAQEVLPPLLASFLAAHPLVRVELVASENILDLAAHRLDVALRAAESLADSGYVASRLLEVELGLYAAPRYLARAGTPRGELAALAGHSLLLRQAEGRNDELWLSRAGQAPQPVPGRVTLQASSCATIKAAAVEGLGVACLPVVVARRAVADGLLRRVLPRHASRSAYLYLVHARGLLPARVRAFRDHVRRVLVR